MFPETPNPKKQKKHIETCQQIECMTSWRLNGVHLQQDGMIIRRVPEWSRLEFGRNAIAIAICRLQDDEMQSQRRLYYSPHMRISLRSQPHLNDGLNCDLIGLD